MALLTMERGRDNNILRATSKPVKKFDRQLVKFVEDMIETMFHEQGIGLAAPQVGVNSRVVVCRFNHETPHEVIVPMINPVIIQRSKEISLNEEGCLSLPKVFDSIARHDGVIVKFMDVKKKENVLQLSDLNARIVQHEVDHIDGKLFIDHLSDKETKNLKTLEKKR